MRQTSTPSLKLNTHALFLIFFTSFFHFSCSYRMSNSTLSVPAGISSIYIESVYDTSAVALPHDSLWEEIQRAAISSGKIKLAGRLDADAHLTTHILYSKIDQTDAVPRTVNNDPNYTPGQTPASYREFRNLNTSSQFANKENLVLTVAVQLIDRKTGKSVFKREYTVNKLYQIIDVTTERPNRFQRADEAFESNFQSLSGELATRIIGDLLSNR